MYPWKRWHTRNDPVSNSAQPPISFFMPTSNSQQLISVFQEFVSIADDVSAIPKYVCGQAGAGGAGRTASGLAMLMGNASKILQTVSANIDREVIEPALLQLTDLIMLTDNTGLLNGEEKITVQGVNVAVQKETLRQRQIEFLQATANPIDMKIVGIKGRANVLRSVSTTIGLDGDEIVPPEQEIDKMVEQQQQQEQQGPPLDEQVQKGVQKGVEAGVQRISTELTAGLLAQRAQMPEGMPTHIGTLPGGNEQPATNNPSMDLGPGGDAARQAQGGQAPHGVGGGMAPTTALTGNQPGPMQPGGPARISPGVG